MEKKNPGEFRASCLYLLAGIGLWAVGLAVQLLSAPLSRMNTFALMLLVSGAAMAEGYGFNASTKAIVRLKFFMCLCSFSFVLCCIVFRPRAPRQAFFRPHLPIVYSFSPRRNVLPKTTGFLRAPQPLTLPIITPLVKYFWMNG